MLFQMKETPVMLMVQWFFVECKICLQGHYVHMYASLQSFF